MTKPFAQIAINSPLRSLFDYKTKGIELVPGQRVTLPFGNREMVGMVVNTTDSTELEAHQLKAIHMVIDQQASLSKHLLDFILWSAHYYHHPVGEALFHALPARLREPVSIDHKDFFLWKISEKGLQTDASKMGNAKLQAKALLTLQKHPEGIGALTCQSLGINNASLKALEDKGLVQQTKPSPKHPQSEEHKHLLRTPELILNTEQKTAFEAIKEKLSGYQSFLLMGVTGSGKTEVYLQAIHETLKEGKQALVLVPEIGLTPQTIQRFQMRFNCPVVSLHSGLTETERFKNWYRIKQNHASIVIGTRSAIFSDFANLGLIIVDEEHDLSYKQQEGFRYSARDLAVVRAQQWKVPVILGSATPSLESLYNTQQGRYELLQLNQKASGFPEPEIKVVDVRGQELQAGMTHKTLQSIRHHLGRKEQVLVFLNRRGYTPALLCPECKWLATCPFCDARFTFHKQKNLLVCHHCNYRQAPIKQCPSCGHGEMQALGQGTEKVEEMLATHFKKTPILRIDRDSTEKKNALEDRLDQLHTGKPCILVGTQMITKGHHFPKVTLVCILDMDQGFFASDFRATERMAQVLVQIIGRAGRESAHSLVIMQTEMPDHPALQMLLTEGYKAFSEELLEEREAMRFPPFSYFCLIRADATVIEHSINFLEEIKACMNNNIKATTRILGPAPASMQKRAGRHRAQLMIQSSNRKDLQQLLNQSITLFSEQQHAKKVRWSVDVDPMETF